MNLQFDFALTFKLILFKHLNCFNKKTNVLCIETKRTEGGYPL